MRGANGSAMCRKEGLVSRVGLALVCIVAFLSGEGGVTLPRFGGVLRGEN